MVLSSRFEQALAYAVIAHAGQVKKSTAVPYVAHLLTVAGLALEYGATEDEAIGALLHDVAEDAGGEGRLADVRQRFGDAVADIVAACSDTFVTPKPPARKRKEQYLEHLAEERNRSALLVSACDKLANARSTVKDFREVGESVFDRFNLGRDGTLWYYRALSDLLTNRFRHPVVAEFARVVSELEHLAAAR